MMEACLSVVKPNKTVGPIILAAVIDITPRKRPPASSVADRKDAGASAEAKIEFLDHEGEILPG